MTFPAAQTTVVIDPPRKGCDTAFLSQLLAFDPASIVYVSCNVHTQARDVGYIVKESGERFVVDSICGADLFPQTHHVESVAVLRRKQA
jgi:tRNA (uracil-5-)-methyltransferase